MSDDFMMGLRIILSLLLILFTVVLSLIVLAAHFWRAGNPLLVLVCLGVIVLLGVRRRWAARTVQIVLWVGTIAWLGTLWNLVAMRRAAGEPCVRLAAILGGVALFTALSSLVLSLPPMSGYYLKSAPGKHRQSTEQDPLPPGPRL